MITASALAPHCAYAKVLSAKRRPSPAPEREPGEDDDESAAA